MLLWRISDFASLDGERGFYSNGRWHAKGKPIVYAADASALAILESLVRIGRITLPQPYQLLRIDAPDDIAVAHWRGDVPPTLNESRAWGMDWLDKAQTALASVPSAVAPHGRNWLINPAHPDAARVSIVAKSRWPWDKRLFR